MTTSQLTIERGDVRICVTDLGGNGAPVVLLHGLAGSSLELLPTADALSQQFRVILIDQRGHGRSTRRPADLSRAAFVSDTLAVIEQLVPNQKVRLVGQSMGAHTAFLTAAARPDLVERLVMLEGHPGGDRRPDAAIKIGAFFSSWPTPFVDAGSAREFLGDSALATAWINDLEFSPQGLRPRFDPDIMQATIAAVHVPRWHAWENLQTPTLAIFADNGMFTSEEKDELVERRRQTRRRDLANASHDAHLDAYELWMNVLSEYLQEDLA